MQTHTQLADTNNKKSVTVLLDLADQVKPMNITLWLWYTVGIIRKKIKNCHVKELKGSNIQ